MTKYRVKYGRTIWHNDQQYNGGEVVELSEELALHHAINIEVYREPESPVFADGRGLGGSPHERPVQEFDDAHAREAIEDVERES